MYCSTDKYGACTSCNLYRSKICTCCNLYKCTCTSCNLYRLFVQVATCTKSQLVHNIYILNCHMHSNEICVVGLGIIDRKGRGTLCHRCTCGDLNEIILVTKGFSLVVLRQGGFFLQLLKKYNGLYKLVLTVEYLRVVHQEMNNHFYTRLIFSDIICCTVLYSES